MKRTKIRKFIADKLKENFDEEIQFRVNWRRMREFRTAIGEKLWTGDIMIYIPKKSQIILLNKYLKDGKCNGWWERDEDIISLSYQSAYILSEDFLEALGITYFRWKLEWGSFSMSLDININDRLLTMSERDDKLSKLFGDESKG